LYMVVMTSFIVILDFNFNNSHIYLKWVLSVWRQVISWSSSEKNYLSKQFCDKVCSIYFLFTILMSKYWFRARKIKKNLLNFWTNYDFLSIKSVGLRFAVRNINLWWPQRYKLLNRFGSLSGLFYAKKEFS
jgi:hypothetical protein